MIGCIFFFSDVYCVAVRGAEFASRSACCLFVALVVFSWCVNIFQNMIYKLYHCLLHIFHLNAYTVLPRLSRIFLLKRNITEPPTQRHSLCSGGAVHGAEAANVN